MMEKRIRANNSSLVRTGQTKDFPLGMKFLSEGIQYTVRKIYKDTTSDQRLVYSERDGEEVVLLSHLLKERQKESFSVIYDPDAKPKVEVEATKEVQDADQKRRTPKVD